MEKQDKPEGSNPPSWGERPEGEAWQRRATEGGEAGEEERERRQANSGPGQDADSNYSQAFSREKRNATKHKSIWYLTVIAKNKVN
jgi:hypothetical protein